MQVFSKTITQRKNSRPAEVDMNEEEKKEDAGIFVDEDWKQKAAAEKQALEEELAEEAGESSAADGSSEGDYELPPASIASLLQEFSTRALVSLGMIHNPITGDAQVDLKAAAYSIDMLAILQEKTEGNLEDNEAVYLGQLISQLREAFLKVSSAVGAADGPAGEESPGDEEAAPAEEAPAEEAAGEEAGA